MKRSFPISIFGCFILMLAIGTGCGNSNAPKPPAADTSVTANRPMSYKKIDSATASMQRANYLAYLNAKSKTKTDVTTTDFNGAYMIQFKPVKDLADKDDLLLFNGEEPDSPFSKVFTIVSADADYKPITNDTKNCVLQNKTGICPTLCDVTSVDAPTSHTVADVSKYVEALYKKTDKTKDFNAVQIDKRAITGFDDKTTYLLMTWGMEVDSTYTLLIQPCKEDGKVDYNQTIITIPQSDIKREDLSK